MSTIIVSVALSASLLVLGVLLFVATKAYLLISRTARQRHRAPRSNGGHNDRDVTSLTRTQLADRDRVLARVKSMHFQRFLVPFVRFWTAPTADSASLLPRRRRRLAAAVFVTDESNTDDDANAFITMRLEIVFDAALDRFLRSHRLAALIPSVRRCLDADADTANESVVIVSSQSIAQLRAQTSEAYACVVRVPLLSRVADATATEEFQHTALVASWKSAAASETVAINVNEHRD